MRIRSLTIAATAGAILLGSAACSSSTSSTSSTSGTQAASGSTPTQPLVIESILGLSGPIAAIGKAMEQGEEAGISVINAEGGVFGKPVQLKVHDDAGNPTQAVSIVQTLISQGNVQVVQAGTISAEIAATVPVLAKANIFTVHHSIDPTLNNTAKYPDAFSDGYLPSNPADALATEFASLGYKKVGLLTSNAAGDLAQEAVDKTAFAAKGISLVAGIVPQGAVDATSQFEQVLAAKPDVLLLDTYGEEAGPIVKARAELDPKIPAYGGQLLTSNNLGSIAPVSDYQGMKLQSIEANVKGSPESKTPAFQKFYSAIMKESDGNLPFTINTYLTAYCDMIVAATAAKLADSTSAAKMAAVMDHITPAQMPDYVGPVTFTSTNHFPNFDAPYWEFVNYGPIVNGQLVPSGS